ncbi:MAG TPA: FHA domain-containing protein [Gemmataceae bacterium]|nr:FHA domain-containing protein [Gemmataceae bacterium]
MKLSLVVQSEGKAFGQTIPINLSQFIVGRDPQCQLRPSSALISKRHCALIARGGKFFVRDFDSTNGTFVNDKQVKGECEIKHEDSLKIGPLAFKVVVEGAASVPVNKPTPLPKALATSPDANDDDSVAAMLLDLADEGKAEASGSESVPGGSTITEMPATVEQAVTQGEGEPKAAELGDTAKAAAKKKDMSGDTSAAAQAILQKYMRRQRG